MFPLSLSSFGLADETQGAENIKGILPQLALSERTLMGRLLKCGTLMAFGKPLQKRMEVVYRLSEIMLQLLGIILMIIKWLKVALVIIKMNARDLAIWFLLFFHYILSRCY